MCDICLHTPCLPGCPNRKKDHVLCEECGQPIKVGEYFKVEDENGLLLCDKCLDKLIDEYQNKIEQLYMREILTEEDIQNL